MEPGSRPTIGSSSFRSRWSLALALAAGLSLSVTMPVQAATDSVDQSQTISTSFQRLSPMAQTFTAGVTGQVDRVSLASDTSFGFVTLTVQIQSVTGGGAPSGTVLGSSSFQGTVTCCKQFHDFALTPRVPVTAGTQYAIVVDVSVGLFTWYNSWIFNAYPGGQLYVGCLGCAWFTGSQYGQDFAFKTWVSTNQAPLLVADNAVITVNEGTKPTNTGTFSDADGDSVTITASSGTVTQSGTSSGTWSWSQPAGDEAAVETITLTANDSKGLAAAPTTFTVTVEAVAPNVSISSATSRLSAATLSTSAAASSPEGTKVTLNGSASSPAAEDNPLVNYSWTVTKDGKPFGVPGSDPAAFSFTPDDEGTFVATLEGTDHTGLKGSASVTINATNVSPSARITSAAPTSGLPLLVFTPNLSFTFAGSFSDPGALDLHKAVWNFGDGATSTTEFGAGGSAALSVAHSYSAAGNYTVTLTVTDYDGGMDQATTKVAILTPQQALSSISGSVQKIASLNDGQKNSLTVKLNAANSSLARGDTKPANNQLNAFLNEVQALVNSGRVSSGDAAALRNSVHAVQAAIGTYNRFLEWWSLGA
jgi:hypothetical protein